MFFVKKNLRYYFLTCASRLLSGDLNEVLESNFCSAEVVEIMETGGDEKKLRKVSGLLDIGNGCGKCTAVYTRVVKVMLLIGGKSLGKLADY